MSDFVVVHLIRAGFCFLIAFVGFLIVCVGLKCSLKVLALLNSLRQKAEQVKEKAGQVKELSWGVWCCEVLPGIVVVIFGMALILWAFLSGR